MKKLLLIVLSLVVLSSCLKYAEPPLLSLSGLYVIDKITTNDTTYNIGDTLMDVNDILLPTLDTSLYIVGDTLFEMDYSMIRFSPIQGGLNWEKEYYYYASGQRNVYDFGYIKFDCEGTRRIWKILDDGFESLTIRIQPNEFGEYMVLSLTRIGP
jgi:hypothetical protein